MTEQLLKPAAAAQMLNVAVATLARWRSLGVGPSYLKTGAGVRYDPASLQAWLDAQRRTSTRDSNGVA